ncbi:hypothetical protein GCM10010405_46700 [Streptomyces macrosporus]|uniref:Uncharacterized protein n=1 Tax=Streptomyces macrosporus TaxID=44032 RepID=A0ABP5XIW4_9ACTN
MCVRVHYASVVMAPWDPQQETITIPAHLKPPHALRAVRRVLAELAVVQPEEGAVCWCGEPITLGLLAVPAQRCPSER